MAYSFKSLKIDQIAVIGAGQIGPDIALHFAKSLCHFNVRITVVDISQEAISKAAQKVAKKIQKGIETGVFKPEQAEKINNAIRFSLDYEDVREANMILEAATEDVRIKEAIFQRLESLTQSDCIFLSNSSHLPPELIFQHVAHKSRCLVAHYFFPAEINPVIELVAGKETDTTLVDVLLGFYTAIGKISIRVKSAYGYAIDPIFEGLCQTAIHCLENGKGNEKEIDLAAQKALGLGVGPFTALNLTGGNPITAVGLDEYHEVLSPWFRTPALLREKNARKEAWVTASRQETVTLNPERATELTKILQGAYFALSSLILDTGIVQIDDLNLGVEMALVMKPPFAMMNEIGIQKTGELVAAFCQANPAFAFPKSLEKALNEGGWSLHDIVTEISQEGVLMITIRRPKVLNALNLRVLLQIREAMEKYRKDDAVKAVVITGFGSKAFVSGADLQVISTLRTPGEAAQNSRDFHAVFHYIEAYPKPVVCALNGYAFGGGSELATSCTARIARKDLPVVFCQPEVKLGFIPGAGGTQRLPRLIGIKKAAEILRTARPVDSREALALGYLQREAQGDLVEEAKAFALEIAEGKCHIPALPKDPLEVTAPPEALNIGSLSRKIDEILVNSIYTGFGMSLQDGLEQEAQLFGACLLTRDMKIGLDNFKQNGPKIPAEFIHE